LTLLLGFSAVNTGNNLLFLVVSGLLAFMCVTGLAGMSNIKGLVPAILPPDEIFAGTSAPFRLRVRNSKRHLPSFLIRVECQSGQSQVFSVIDKQASRDGSVMLTFSQRGRVQVGRVTVSSSYPVGFFTRYWTFEIDTVLTVFPQPLAGVYPSSGDHAPRSGSGLLRDRGLDGELERIDPYTGAEPLRMIHWKLSARSADFLVKGFGRQSSIPLTIDIEALPGRGVEERLSRAAWLVQRWVRERPVGLVLGDRIIPSGCGRQHGRTLLAELAVYGLN
jgi:uncharacterized protein (DUF58 family)